MSKHFTLGQRSLSTGTIGFKQKTAYVLWTCTCVKIEDTCRLALHSDCHIVPLYVGSTDASVRQLNLKEASAALHVVERHIVETRFYVCLIGIEGLVENVLHDLGSKKDINSMIEEQVQQL